MIVYRVIRDIYSYGLDNNDRNEYKDYINNIISIPKKSFNDGWNTHHYKDNKSYLHFFHFYESAMEYIMSIPSIRWNERTYIALYDIPNELLDEGIGFGYYPDTIHSKVPFLEYAIPFCDLNNKFIEGFIIKYNYNIDFSEKYIEYVKSQYNEYLKKISEEDQKLIKSLCRCG